MFTPNGVFALVISVFFPTFLQVGSRQYALKLNAIECWRYKLEAVNARLNCIILETVIGICFMLRCNLDSRKWEISAYSFAVIMK